MKTNNRLPLLCFLFLKVWIAVWFPSKKRGCLDVIFHISLRVRVAEAWTEEGGDGQIRHNQIYAYIVYFMFLSIGALLVRAVLGQWRVVHFLLIGGQDFQDSLVHSLKVEITRDVPKNQPLSEIIKPLSLLFTFLLFIWNWHVNENKITSLF